MTLSDPEPVNRCSHKLWADVDGVRCTREANHKAGHTYLSGDGSACPDRHQEASQE